jgi:hypothetical protein
MEPLLLLIGGVVVYLVLGYFVVTKRGVQPEEPTLNTRGEDVYRWP